MKITAAWFIHKKNNIIEIYCVHVYTRPHFDSVLSWWNKRHFRRTVQNSRNIMLRCDKNGRYFRRCLANEIKEKELGSLKQKANRKGNNSICGLQNGRREKHNNLTWNIRPTIKSIHTQEIMSPWFVIINSWLSIGAFLPDFRLLGIFPAIKAQEEKKEADWCPSFSPPTNRYPVYYADICERWGTPI